MGFEQYEGYVGKKEDFNGIIFYLKEPNTEGEKVSEFWFQKIVLDQEGYYDNLSKQGCENIKRSKSIASKFKNRFNEILNQLGMNEKQLCDTVYCNVHAEMGKNSASGEYEQALEKADKKLYCIINEMEKEELIVFTCIDIYNRLKKAWKIDKEYSTGLKYRKKDKSLPWFQCTIGNRSVKVYEILHPSRSPKLESEK